VPWSRLAVEPELGPLMPDTLTPGTQIGAYRIERRLGRGGMSTVYLAEQSGLNRKVALKVMSAELAEDERFRERFVRESELAASLDAPNVLPVYEAGEHDGVLFIAMRFVDGTDLQGLLEQGPLDPALTVEIVTQVARALDAAHAKGLVHRDVKPANILLARGDAVEIDHVYLSDFGLTKRAASDSGLTGTGVFAGTLSYAAPEQFEGTRLDARTDVYSLGCVVFECLTGSPPFRREQDAALMYAHLNEPPPSVSELRPDLPAAVDEVISRAMAKDPDRRFQRAGELAGAFGSALEPGASSPRPTKRLVGKVALVAAAVGILAGVAFALVGPDVGDGSSPSGSGGTSSGSAAAPPGGSLLRIDAETGEPVATFSEIPGLGAGGPFRPLLAIGEGGAWLYSFGHQTPFLLEIDEETGSVRGRLTFDAVIGGGPALAVGERTVSLSGAGEPGQVTRVNPSTGDFLDPLSVRTGTISDLALGDDRLWAAASAGGSEGTLTEFDALTGRRVDDLAVAATPDAIAYAEGSIWVLDTLSAEVVEIDATSGDEVARIAVSGNPSSIAAGDGGVWVLDAVAGTVTQLDPSTTTAQAPIRVGPSPSSIAVGLGEAWITDEDGNLYRVDPDLGAREPIGFGSPLGPVAVDEETRSVWVGVLSPSEFQV